MEERDIELIDYLNVIWKRKGLIISGTLLAAAAALLVSLRTPETYVASVTLMVTESKVPSAEGRQPVEAGLSTETFEGMIRNKSLAQRAIQKFDLDKEPYEYSPRDVLKGVISVETERGTNLIGLTVKFPDARLAADLANFLAEQAVELNTQLNRADTLKTRDYIKAQLDKARAKMEREQTRVVEFRREAGLGTLQKETEVLLAQKAKLESKYVDVLVHLEELKASPLEARLDEAEMRLLRFRQKANLPSLRAGLQSLLTQKNDLDDQYLAALVHLEELKSSPLEARLDEAETRLLRFRQEANLASLRAERDILLQEKSKLTHAYRDVLTAIQGHRAKLKNLSEQIKEHQKVETIIKSIEKEPGLLIAAAEGNTTFKRDLLSLQMKSEEFNPVYRNTEQALVTIRGELAALEARRDDLAGGIQAVEKKLAAVGSQLAQKEVELERLTRDYNLARDEWKRQVGTSMAATIARQKVLREKLGENASQLTEVQEQLTKQEIKLQRLTREYNLAKDESTRLFGTSMPATMARKKVLEQAMKRNEDQLTRLQIERANKEARMEELTRNYTLAKDAYQLFARKFEEASLSVASRVNDLKIVDRAVIPRDPVNPRVKLNVALAGTLGLMMFTFLAFFLEYIEKARRAGRVMEEQ